LKVDLIDLFPCFVKQVPDSDLCRWMYQSLCSVSEVDPSFGIPSFPFLSKFLSLTKLVLGFQLIHLVFGVYSVEGLNEVFLIGFCK